MANRYYLDTAIWMDLYEDRKGYLGEPLGDIAWALISKIMANKDKIVITDMTMKEMEIRYSLEMIRGIFKPFELFLEAVLSSKQESEEARLIAHKRNLSYGDVMHAILARDHKLILVTRDKHFRELRDISKFYLPEELI